MKARHTFDYTAKQRRKLLKRTHKRTHFQLDPPHVYYKADEPSEGYLLLRHVFNLE